MNATTLLQAAWNAGIALQADDGSLLLNADVEPPVSIVAELANHKSEILSLLAPDPSGWSDADWLKYFIVCADAVKQKEGWDFDRCGLIAFETCVSRWLTLNPPHPYDQTRCAHCGLDIGQHGHDIPITHARAAVGILHSNCADDWSRRRSWKARRALLWLIHPQDARSWLS